MRFLYLVLFSILLLQSCYVWRPLSGFDDCAPPMKADYQSLDGWAAHPLKKDSADLVPFQELYVAGEDAKADVFFIHPTSYIGKISQTRWNAPVDDPDLNEDTDDGSIKNQATVFNECFKIYAPRYRQAHYRSYLTNKKIAAKKAFELAYSDVKSAFEFYLKNYNNGRPIVIAGHSQGSQHAIRLLKEYFDNKPLSAQLVAIYIPGMPVRESFFQKLGPCVDKSETCCINTWRTLKEGEYPKHHDDFYYDDAIMTNPLTGDTTTLLIDPSFNEGSVLYNFYDGVTPNVAGAQIVDGLLWTPKPKFKGSYLLTRKDYHPADYNLYYINIRNNACERLDTYLSNH